MDFFKTNYYTIVQLCRSHDQTLRAVTTIWAIG
jgi:hypothetical protein